MQPLDTCCASGLCLAQVKPFKSRGEHMTSGNVQNCQNHHARDSDARIIIIFILVIIIFQIYFVHIIGSYFRVLKSHWHCNNKSL